MDSQHARTRAQQRAIPPLVDEWLDRYGEEEHDGRGGVQRYFSRRSIRAMERDLGAQPVAICKRYLGAYRVDSSHDGTVITRGWRTRRLRRR